MKTKNSGTKVLIKTILFIVFALFDIFLLYGAYIGLVLVNEEKDITYALENLEEDYYEKDYVSLIDNIDLYNFYDEDVKIYKEAGDAYILKMTCTIFAANNDSEGYSESLDKLEKMLATCEPQNKAVISSFIEEVK